MSYTEDYIAGVNSLIVALHQCKFLEPQQQQRRANIFIWLVTIKNIKNIGLIICISQLTLGRKWRTRTVNLKTVESVLQNEASFLAGGGKSRQSVGRARNCVVKQCIREQPKNFNEWSKTRVYCKIIMIAIFPK